MRSMALRDLWSSLSSALNERAFPGKFGNVKASDRAAIFCRDSLSSVA